MVTIRYKDHRIEIRPAPVPGGWGAQVHIWSFANGTTRMTLLALPTHIPFGTERSVCTYAEKVARQWVDQQSAGGSQLSPPPSLASEEEAGSRAGTPTYSLSSPTRLKRSGTR